jgi:hypothetical protein
LKTLDLDLETVKYLKQYITVPQRTEEAELLGRLETSTSYQNATELTGHIKRKIS